MPTARQTPTGRKIDDGFPTKIAFAADPDVSLWEKTVKPPGMDGGDAIETTTMWNSQVRTFASRALITLTESSFQAAYDPKVYDQILALINVETLITVHFSDGTKLDFYGFLRTFEPGDISEGEQPTAQCSITPTNTNPSTGAESLPNYLLAGSA